MYIPWTWYVYVLECEDGWYYTGLTWNVAFRIEQHLSGQGGAFTARHGVKRLCWVETCSDFSGARWREHQIKDYSRQKKEALWRGQEHIVEEYNKSIVAMKKYLLLENQRQRLSK